jgi:aminoglycoside phosphotransferase
MDRFERLKALNSQIYSYKQSAQQEFESLFKPGQVVFWMKSKRLQSGVVIRLYADQALEAKNSVTGKQYTVHVEQLLEAANK